MGAAYLTYTLILITTFYSEKREMVLFPGYTQETCEIQAAEDNTNWELFGDRTTFRSVKAICIPSRKVP